MTISSLPSEASYAGDGISTIFPIPFVFDAGVDLKVIRTDRDGNPVVLASGYSISGGNGAPGNCTLDSPLAVGVTLTILDNLALTQDADYANSRAFTAKAQGHALDRSVRMSKRLNLRLQRSLRFPDGDAVVNGELDVAANRKGKYLFFNASTGAPEYAAQLAGSTLSSSLIGATLDSLKRTNAEIAAGVTPVNYAWPPGTDLRYGVVRDDATDNQLALEKMIAVGAQGTQITLTQGVARHSGTLDWSHDNLRVSAEGKSQFRHTGKGVANKFDGGRGSVTNIIFDGYIEEIGCATTTIGWYIRALARSRLHIRAKNATTYGCQIQFAVLCEIRFGLTRNDVAIETEPTYGLALMKRDDGEQVAGCRFPNVFIEGLTKGTGILLASCFCCDFMDGSSEGNAVGVEVSGAENNINTFQNCDFEANLAQDVIVSGGSNLKFINCHSVSATSKPNIALDGGDSTAFIGGFYRWIDCVGGKATNTAFISIQVPDDRGVGITGSGTKKILGVQKVLPSPGNGPFRPILPPSSGVVHDEVGESGDFEPPPSIFGGRSRGAQAYAGDGQKGYWVRVGRLVQFTIFLKLATNSGGSGPATIGGLPFTSRRGTNAYQTISVGEHAGVTLSAAGRVLAMRISPGSTTGVLVETDTGNPVGIGAISATAQLVISGSYMIDG